MKDEWGCPCCSEWQILGMDLGRKEIHALISLFLSVPAHSALPSCFWKRFSGLLVCEAWDGAPR